MRGPDKGRPARKTKIDMHAGESETSKMMVARPDLVHGDRAASESGGDQARGKLPSGVYTGIWWYTRFPNRFVIPSNARDLGFLSWQLNQDFSIHSG